MLLNLDEERRLAFQQVSEDEEVELQELKDFAMFFDNEFELFEFIYTDETEGVDDLYEVVHDLGVVTLDEMKKEKAKNVYEYVILTHEHVRKTDYGYVFYTMF